MTQNDATQDVSLTINGRPVTVRPAEEETLLDVLRDHLGLLAAKDGCQPEGYCGCCTVLVDGKARVACSQAAARFAGKDIVTLEGLGDEEREAFALAFAATGASQCGFCSPGIVVKARSLLDKNAAPSRDDVAKALAGNLCRCTGYVKVIDAIQMAGRILAGDEQPRLDFSGRIGTRAPKYEAFELALGKKPFINDMSMDGMLHGALRYADHPRAIVRSIDTSHAEALDGVVAVVLAGDVPGERDVGAIVNDWPVLVAAGETTRCEGDVLAAVVAETRVAARRAAAAIEVDYEVLEPVTDPERALEPDAPRVHPKGNLLKTYRIERGDVDRALAQSAHVVTETFQTQFIEHAFLEPESSLAFDTGDGMRVLSGGQGIWDDRRQIARILGEPEDRVRVTLVSNGGAFGAKEDLGVNGHAALLARLTGRPVKVTLSREESIRMHAKRHPLRMTYTVGCDERGVLTAVKARIVGDTGAYASVGDKVLQRACGHSCSAYEVPAVYVESHAVYTNNPPCGAMRGFGSNQANFAMEGCLDRLAHAVGIDGWDIRWLNALETGKTFATGQVLGEGVGLKRCLEAVRDAYKQARHAGVACAVKNVGVGNGLPEYGRASLEVGDDGSITLRHSWTEMGQGVHTVLQQVAVEELHGAGLELKHVGVRVDTEREFATGQTTASRGTFLGGLAVKRACEKLRAELNGNRLADLAGREFTGEVEFKLTQPMDDSDLRRSHICFGWGAQVCILDDNGAIAKIIAAHDVGRVMNRNLLEGQLEGSVHMGLGHSLTEELVVEDARIQTPTLKSQGIIPAKGMPEVECIFVEEAQPEGPYGAKGVGEIGLVPTAAAIAAAAHAHDGVWRTRLPMKDTAAARAAHPKAVGKLGKARRAAAEPA
ncbi:MAG TPA: selenium-dependent xanthine dehydrogenase [Actinomycetota bacterium]|nr:selenium-dependent xanthine dehydrogenase [Actinomycetota bacterium]